MKFTNVVFFTLEFSRFLPSGSSFIIKKNIIQGWITFLAHSKGLDQLFSPPTPPPPP